jgi:hypothetical protein
LDSPSKHRRRNRLFWGGALVALAAAAALAGRTPALGGTAPAAAEQSPVVLTGGYTCAITDYVITGPPVPYPPPDPPAEVETFRDLFHYISLTATGGVVTPNTYAGIGPGSGPGYGGVRGGRFVTTAPVNLGSGISGSFDGGTGADCQRFAETVAAVARGLGCVLSDVRHRGPVYQQESVQVSFVCEGGAAATVHAIGELDRAVVGLRLGGS